jgi:hypothetical protein
VKWGFGFSGPIRRTAPFSRLVWHARGCWGPVVTRILTSWQKMLTPSRHLTPPLVYPGVFVCPSLWFYFLRTSEIDDCSFVTSAIILLFSVFCATYFAYVLVLCFPNFVSNHQPVFCFSCLLKCKTTNYGKLLRGLMPSIPDHGLLSWKHLEIILQFTREWQT